MKFFNKYFFNKCDPIRKKHLVTFIEVIFNGKLHFFSSLSDYQLKVADLYNIPIGNVKKLGANFF